MNRIKIILVLLALIMPVKNAFADSFNLSLALSGGTGLYISNGSTERSSFNLRLTPGITLFETVRIECGVKIDLEAKDLAEDVASTQESAQEAQAAKDAGDIENAAGSGIEAAEQANEIATTEYRLLSLEPGLRVFPVGGLFLRAAVGPDIIMDGPANFKTQIRIIGGLGYEFHFSVFGLFLEADAAKAVGGDIDAGQPNPIYVEGRLGVMLII